MSFYRGVFEFLGVARWCDGDTTEGPMTMAQLLAKAGVNEGHSGDGFPFPSLDELHKACPAIPRTRDFTATLEQAFLNTKDIIKILLDPITAPLNWFLDGALLGLTFLPWFVLLPLLLAFSYYCARSLKVVGMVLGAMLFMMLIDHYNHAMQTLAIIFVCTGISVVVGVPIGIGMSKYNRFQKSMIPVLDILQTLPSFVYLIPLIFLFSVTESRLFGIAIILYAIVPVIRLTDLGIRLVDQDIIEAANAFGMSPSQKLIRVEIPLAMPNIMAGINQTIMMSLAMVVIASLVSAPGLGVLVLRGIRNLELGVGLVSGLCIVILAVLLDRISKATLQRTHKTTHDA